MSKYNKYLAMARSRKWCQPTPTQVEEWLKDHTEYKWSGNQIRINNPDGDTKFHLYISPDKAVVHDFRPNHQQWDGSFIKFVAKFKNITVMDAIKEICGNSKIVTQYQQVAEDKPENEDIIALPIGAVPVKDGTGKIRDVVMMYLRKERGLSEDIIYRANVHHLGTNICTPYYQYGMIVFYQIRYSLTKKFLFPPGASTGAGDYLYGFDDVEPCGEVITVESIFNKLSIGYNTVATGGAALKDGQIKLLKALNPHTVILAPDNDDAGKKSLQADYFALNKERKGDLFKEIWYCLPPVLPGVKDWNELLLKGINPMDYIQKNKKKLTGSVLFTEF